MLTNKEQRVLNETRLRNLKRKHAKLTTHAEFADEALETMKQIQTLEQELYS